jgi:hypothetical protein
MHLNFNNDPFQQPVSDFLLTYFNNQQPPKYLVSSSGEKRSLSTTLTTRQFTLGVTRKSENLKEDDVL